MVSAFFFLLAAHTAQAQRSLGVFYEPEADTAAFRADLARMDEAGISTIVFQKALPFEQLQQLQDFNFSYIQHTGLTFLTTHKLASTDLPAVIGETVLPYFDVYIAPEAVIVFSHSAISSRAFNYRVARDIEAVRGADLIGLRTYRQQPAEYSVIQNWITQISSYDNIRKTESSHWYYKPKSQDFDIRDFQALMAHVGLNSTSVTYLDWDLISDSDYIYEVIQAYATDPEAIFPNPAEDPKIEGNTFLSIIFLIIWISVAAHVLVQSSYLPSLMRYIQTHNFFMADIFERRIRIGAPNTYLLMQWALLGGITIYLFATERLSRTGLEAICQFIGISEQPSVILIISAGILFVLILNGLYLFWLYFAHSEINHISQAAVLQIWPQHVLLLIASVALLLVLMNANILLLDIITLIFFAFVTGSFLISSFDASRQAQTGVVFYLLSFGLYFLLLAAGIYYGFINNGFFEIIQLARGL